MESDMCYQLACYCNARRNVQKCTWYRAYFNVGINGIVFLSIFTISFLGPISPI